MPPRQGGFSEYLTMPERNLIEVPDGVALTAAALAEPLACGWHAVRLARSALFKPLEAGRVLVLGGGAIGLGAALAARLHGASEIWIAETNAKHRKGDMITIMRADLGKLFSNPEAVQQLDNMEESTREEAQKLCDSVDGIDMDLQDPITVRVK